MTPSQKWREKTKLEIRKEIAFNTLKEMHAFNVLKKQHVTIIGRTTGIDAEALCAKHGITYETS